MPAIKELWKKLRQDQPASRDRKKFYKFGKVLGSGTFGEVKYAIFTPGPQEVAVKIIKKANLSGCGENVLREIASVEALDHPNIVKLYDWFESKEKYYLVLQLCLGGELFEKICERGHFTEKDAVQLVKVAFETVAFLHENNVVHRDIKPENFLFLNNQPDSPLMLADFGIAKSLNSEDEKLMTMCGSFGYVAPEVLLRKGHGKPVDIWSLGVVMYSILCGYSPFWEYEKYSELLNAMQLGKINFDERYWWGISEDAKDLIRACLNPDPELRITAHDALKHPWLCEDVAQSNDLLPSVRQNFNPRLALRTAINKVRLVNRIRDSPKPEDLLSDQESEPISDSESRHETIPEQNASPAKE